MMMMDMPPPCYYAIVDSAVGVAGEAGGIVTVVTDVDVSFGVTGSDGLAGFTVASGAMEFRVFVNGRACHY